MDNIGQAAAAARQTLSEGRAKIVAAWLTAHGVAAGKVTSKGYGKTRPIAENDSDLGRALNRRIEVACRNVPSLDQSVDRLIGGSYSVAYATEASYSSYAPLKSAILP